MLVVGKNHRIDLDKRFPDGTFAFHVPDLCSISNDVSISWYYEGEHELSALLYLTNHLRQSSGIKSISLILPYCPNSRMDRTHHEDEVFTLKYFAQFINSLKFESVSILDPHSSATTALIDRCKVLSPEKYIQTAIKSIDDPDLLLFYPDEGAMKRYSGMIQKPYGFGIKRRQWETGKITGLDVICGTKIKGKNVLIVDDICCRGGTFFYSAKALKELGAKTVSVFCSHCEHAIFDGELLATDVVEHIYTTNSIFNKEHKKITVFPVELNE